MRVFCFTSPPTPLPEGEGRKERKKKEKDQDRESVRKTDGGHGLKREYKDGKTMSRNGERD